MGDDRVEVVKNFREALIFHMKQDPTYKIPEQPSPKSKSKDHIKARADEFKKYGRGPIPKVDLIWFSF